MITAGGGTGTITMFLGEQLNHTNSEVLDLEISNSSITISQKRARVRNLQNIIWIHTWIESVRFLGLGFFDDLQASGVLHHLKYPLLGLKLLKDVLTINGGMSLMVYAQYGRTAIYQMQHMFKFYTKHDIEKEIYFANETLKFLPKDNWFILNPIVSDHKAGNIGIYDLLLHKRDVAYSISTLFNWMELGGVHFIEFDSFKKRSMFKVGNAITDTSISKQIYSKNRALQLNALELLRGNVVKHEFYASKMKNSVADLLDTSNVFYLYGSPSGFRDALSNEENQVMIGNELYFRCLISRSSLKKTLLDFKSLPHKAPLGLHHISAYFKWNTFNRFILNSLLTSNKGIVLDSVLRKISINNSSNLQIIRLLKDFYDSVKDTEMFLLRKNSVGIFPKTAFNSYFQIHSF